MPYVNDEMKKRFWCASYENDSSRLSERVDDLIAHIKTQFEEDELEGVCNYTISRIVAGVMKPNTGWRYKWLNRAYGTFLSAAAEFYRRTVGPYEDDCIKKNGDIPEYE